MVQSPFCTFVVADTIVQQLASCGYPDGAGNIQTLNDELDIIRAELIPLAFPAKLQIIHHV